VTIWNGETVDKQGRTSIIEWRVIAITGSTATVERVEEVKVPVAWLQAKGL
jgi:hypothetical protein